MTYRPFLFDSLPLNSPRGSHSALVAWTDWPGAAILADILAAWREDRPIALLNPAAVQVPLVHRLLISLGLTPQTDGRAWTATADAPIMQGLPPGFQAILMTSGTTCAPRLVALDREALVWNATSVGGHLGLMDGGEPLTVLCHVPLFHAFGLSLCFFQALLAGHRFLHTPRFDPNALCRALDEIDGRVFLPLVPTQARTLLSAMTNTRCQTEHLSGVSVVGGDRVEARLMAGLRHALPNLAHTVGYGLTEAGPALTHTDPRLPFTEDGSIGRPLPGVRLLMASETAAWFRSPGQCAALWDEARGHWARSRGQAWLPTGDLLAEGANGTLVTFGRKAWALKKKGETIFSQSIEATIEAELASSLGEEISIVLVEAPGEQLELVVESASSPRRQMAVMAAIITLPSFYRPESIVWVERLPRNQLGKLERHAMKVTS